MKNILIIGSTSAMAMHTARHFAQDGACLMLVARNEQKQTDLIADLKARGAAQVHHEVMDLADLYQHETLVHAAWEKLGQVDAVLMAHGVLGDQEEDQKDARRSYDIIHINFLSYVSLLTPLAEKMEAQGHGMLAVISSVAGLRGRKSNYIYGSSKAGLNAFLSGLRNRLEPKIQVCTILPGTVDTPMTEHMEKGPLFASADKVGEDIYQAMIKGKDVVYTPFYWRFIMLIIRMIPERIFKRLSI